MSAEAMPALLRRPSTTIFSSSASASKERLQHHPTISPSASSTATSWIPWRCSISRRISTLFHADGSPLQAVQRGRDRPPSDSGCATALRSSFQPPAPSDHRACWCSCRARCRTAIDDRLGHGTVSRASAPGARQSFFTFCRLTWIEAVRVWVSEPSMTTAAAGSPTMSEETFCSSLNIRYRLF